MTLAEWNKEVLEVLDELATSLPDSFQGKKIRDRVDQLRLHYDNIWIPGTHYHGA